MGYKTLINSLINGEEIEREEIKNFILSVLNGEIDPVQTAAFLTALRIKGESLNEVLGVAEALREKMVKVECDEKDKLADTCGTGGDNSGTFNISTAVSFLAAAGGFKVAKHGNRSITSASGSADVLVSLGVNIKNLTPQRAEEALKKIGITFLFAPFFHPAMKAVAPVRQKLGFRTIFNIIGPLVNPAGPVSYHSMGVFSPSYIDTISSALREMGTRRGAVFSSYDGMDEVSPFAPTRIIFFNETGTEERVIKPEDFGLKHDEKEREKIKVKNPDESAELIKKIFRGEAPQVAIDTVILNAGVLFALKNGNDISEGISEAKKVLESLKPLEKLNQLVGFSQMEEVKNGYS